MSFIVILIIIAFTNSIYSLISNCNDVVTEPLYNASLFRNKRSPAEYTRWRPNQVSTSEFIVKVLDDDIPSTSTKRVVAVNILPSTKNTEKIIVGGVVVPSPSTALTVKLHLMHYSVLPTLMTTFYDNKDLLFTQVPVPSRNMPSFPAQGLLLNEPPYPQYKFVRPPHRDESPPAGPQFIARTPTLLARQYAPITSVQFTPKSSASLLTPQTLLRYTYSDAQFKPTRTSPFPNGILPSKTSILDNEFGNVQPFDDEEINSNEISVSRSTHFPIMDLERTQNVDYNMNFKTSRDTGSPKFIDYTTQQRKMIDKEKKADEEKELDSPYGMMFYIEEDNDITKKANRKYKDESEEGVLEEPTSTNTNKIGYIDITEKQEPGEKIYLEMENDNDTIAVPKTNETSVLEGSKRRQEITRHNCSLLRLRPLNFKSPRTLPEIVSQLRYWAEHSPVAKWTDITAGNYTLMENPIYMMIVDDPSSGQIISAKQTVMVVAGIQGRDHHAVSAALYVLYQLIERTDVHTDLLSKYRFWIIPVFNPDGYDYSITFPQRREWTKNLRQTWQSSAELDACTVFGLRCSIKPCYGVNLDRNFEYQWIPPDELRAEHPCGDLYAGTRQLSEAETLALTRYLHTQRMPLHTFIAFKEGDVLGIMYPYSHTKKTRAFDHVYRQRASRAASAAYGISGRPYVAGQTSQFLPLYAGGIEDWVDGHLGIDNTYTVMMFRPTDSYNSKYATEHVVHEAYAAMDTLLLHSTEPMLGPPVITLSKSTGHRVFPFPIAYLICTSSLTIITGICIMIRN